MLQGGEGCQEFARVVGDLPVQTLDLTAHTSGECNVTAVISYQAQHTALHGCNSLRSQISDRASQTNIKTCNFDSIVSLINYGFTAIFLYLREKIRLHILISQY